MLKCSNSVLMWLPCSLTLVVAGATTVTGVTVLSMITSGMAMGTTTTGVHRNG